MLHVCSSFDVQSFVSDKPSKCDNESSHLTHVQIQAFLMQDIEGLVETSPGVRSCMIEYDQRVLPLATLLETLLKTEQQLPKVHATRKKQKNDYAVRHHDRGFCTHKQQPETTPINMSANTSPVHGWSAEHLHRINK